MDTKTSLSVFASVGELGYEDMERVSCRAAVCSEWTSCFLLILVSQCPLSSQAVPKRRTLQCTQRQTPLYEGFLSEVTNRLQDNCRDHML